MHITITSLGSYEEQVLGVPCTQELLTSYEFSYQKEAQLQYDVIFETSH